MWLRRGQLVLARQVQGVLVTARPTSRFMASDASDGRGPVYTSIVKAVTDNLAPTEVELIDDSASHAGHAGMKGKEARESHFKLKVVSDKFDGLRLVQRHQLVYALLADQFAAGLHALNIVAKTPAEMSK
mmetsp:Transcript_1164/g.2861  ORF Transcript_1164/g.2861 Transcript_1164/m.2861 type:complete len:130 (+) Transcript_1164:57-446(+)